MKKATDANTANFEAGVYEIFGHGGVGFIAYTLTDNPNRAFSSIKGLLKKNDVKMATGSLLFQFDHRAVFSPQAKYDKDLVLEKGIEKEIDDIQFLHHINGFVKDHGPDPIGKRYPSSISANVDIDFIVNRWIGVHCCRC